jgi:hypothetical protein
MGYVPEEPHLYGHLSGLEYLLMVRQLRNLPPKATADRIDGLLRLFSLHADRYAPISAYSKGMRQKVLLSAALLHNPDLLLLDEPFSGLDVGTGLVQGIRASTVGYAYRVNKRFSDMRPYLMGVNSVKGRSRWNHSGLFDSQFRGHGPRLQKLVVTQWPRQPSHE